MKGSNNMVKHILFVKLKDYRESSCETVKELFLSRKDHIDFIRELQVGIDALHSERSYDVVLEMVVDSFEELERYQKDPYHVNVVKPYIHEVRTGSATVDYAY